MKLVEKFNVTAAPQHVVKIRQLNESQRTLKLSDSSEVKCVGAYTFPISQPGVENLNERVYGADLFERIIKEGQGERRFGLMDHAAEDSEQPDGSVKDAFCVWRNLRFSDDKKYIVADCYLFGEGGRHFQESMDAGGTPGFSMVGYGDYLEDGKTIDPKTYMLDHPADWVLNPSAQVFGELENAIADPAKQDNAPPQAQEKKRMSEKTESDKKMTKLEENMVKKQLTSLIKEAEGLTNIVERRKELIRIAAIIEDDGNPVPDVKAYVDEQVTKLNDQIEELALQSVLKEKDGDDEEDDKKGAEDGEDEDEKDKKELVRLRQDNAQLQTRYDALASMADSLQVYSNRMRELYETALAESKSQASLDDYNEAIALIGQHESTIGKLRKEIAGLRKAAPRRADAGKGKLTPLAQSEEFDFQTNPNDPMDLDDPDMAGNPLSFDDVPYNDEHDPETFYSGHQPSEAAQDYYEAEGDTGPTGDDPDGSGDPSLLEPFKQYLPQVLSYYEDLRRSNPRVTMIRDDILRCRSLGEAQLTYYRLKSLVETTASHNRDAHRMISPGMKARPKAVVEVPTTEEPVLLRKGWN